MAHPVIGQKSTRRKQWTLLSNDIFFFFSTATGVELLFLQRTVMYRCFLVDRTQNRYNRFGTFLAEDGWPDSQVDLAKQLLNDENCGKAIVALKYCKCKLKHNVGPRVCRVRYCINFI